MWILCVHESKSKVYPQEYTKGGEKKKEKEPNLKKIKTQELQTKAALTYSDILNNFLFFLSQELLVLFSDLCTNVIT